MDLASHKYAWKWFIKPEYVEEYVRMHLNPWPEVIEAHAKAGIRNYSIFQKGNEFFYCFECDDIEAAFDYMSKSDACVKWDRITEKMVEGGYDVDQALNSMDFMGEVFYLK